jgi:predicted nucleotidyltransferase
MVDNPNGEFQAIASVCRQNAGVRLGVVFGSRARGDATAASDWDIGIVGDADLDHDALLADLVRSLGTDRIDLVDLEQAGALVRFRAARDGVAVFERGRDAFADFWHEAVDFWCDAGPVIRAGYEAVLADPSG